MIRQEGAQIVVVTVHVSGKTRRKQQTVIGAFRVGSSVPSTLIERLALHERRAMSLWLKAYGATEADLAVLVEDGDC